jgi:hypothetical protein
MDTSVRCVMPELLDGMDAQDPRALRARRDLQRVHRAMRTVGVLTRAVAGLRLAHPPRRILELGGGDGTLMLRFARAHPDWSPVELTLIDMQDMLSARTREAYRSLGWDVHVMSKDALHWASGTVAARHDLCVANLFLHHFNESDVTRLLSAVARDCDALVACEPRRGFFALLGSRLVGLLGASHVTRSDAVTSVVAGFRGGELSALWPTSAPGWSMREYAAFPFTHCFAAARTGAPTPRDAP